MHSCQANDLMDTSLSEDGEDRSEWIHTTELDQITPSISLHTVRLIDSSHRAFSLTSILQ